MALAAPSVVLVHGDVEAGEAERLDDVDGRGQLGVDDGTVVGIEAAEHEVHLCAGREAVADAHAQTGVLLRTEHLLDVAQPVVSARTALALEAQGADGQGEVVDDDEQVLAGDVLLVQPVADGVAAEVHERGGLEQHELAVLDGRVGHVAVAAVLKNSIGRLGKGVQYVVTYVVAGVFVFVAWIAQTDYQVFCHTYTKNPG